MIIISLGLHNLADCRFRWREAEIRGQTKNEEGILGFVETLLFIVNREKL